MTRLRKVIRALFVTVLLLVVAVPSLTYIVLSTPGVQNRIRKIAETELATLLGTPVEIGEIKYKPFNTLTVGAVCVKDSVGEKVLGIGRIAARFELVYFLRTKRLLFDYAVVDSPEIRLNRQTPESPLNISPILARLSKKDSTEPPKSFDLKIGTIILRDGYFTYDVLSEPPIEGRFDKNHISIKDFNFHAYLRHAAPDDVDILLESMSFKEKSGFALEDFTTDVNVGPRGAEIKSLVATLPSSRIALKPIRLDCDGFSDFERAFRTTGISVDTEGYAEVDPADLSSFVPALGELNIKIKTGFDIFLNGTSAELKKFDISTDNGITAAMNGRMKSKDESGKMSADINITEVSAPGGALGQIVARHNKKAADMLDRLSVVKLQGKISGSESDIKTDITVGIDAGELDIKLDATTTDRFRDMAFNGRIDIKDFPAGILANDRKIGNVTASVDADGDYRNGVLTAEGKAEIISAVWNDRRFSDISVDGKYTPTYASAEINSRDADAAFVINAVYGAEGNRKNVDLDLRLINFCPEGLNLGSPHRGFAMSGNLKTHFEGTTINDAEGSAEFTDMHFSDEEGGDLTVSRFSAELERNADSDLLTIKSDFLNGQIEGEINPAGLPLIVRDMLSHIVPAVFPLDEGLHRRLAEQNFHNKFVADLTIDNAENLCRYLRLPVTVIYAIDILANVNSYDGTIGVSVDVPYLQQGDKIIDSTVVGAFVNTETEKMAVYASTHMPTKKGPMTLVLGIAGSENVFDTKIDWMIDRTIPLNGMIDFSTALSRTGQGNVCVETRFNPGNINFGDDVWDIHPSTVGWCDNIVTVDNFRLTAGPQSININGRGSESEDDIIDISLKDITMISIFETLEIENAMIGGTANGDFRASQILSKIPVITTDNLHVDSISYNHCIVGTADVKANWDNEKQSVFLNADIINPEGLPSNIHGDIFPAGERLDLYFKANHIRVGFMQTFMAAFASDVSGYGSGTAHLFGTFHDIDMEGDIYAEDLKLKIDFTNTVYSATDSIHIVPGIIKLDNITIRDTNGHTALLNGILTHKYFHLPEFNFRVTDARDFLCYNITEAMNPDWYGTIYGNGSATVSGRPGIIDIGANMSTAPGTVFTFVLSDRLDAEQYSFITFNDVTELTAEEKLAADNIPEAVRLFRERMNAKGEDKPSDYNLDFRVDITPEAQMILVMDPVGGDRIRAYGSGDMRLTYNSTENDIRMYGTYTLDRGSYNFTLQDIIIKDFIIDAGSSITFRGDPYSAQLNIEAAYQLNANLSDLDESFTLDKDLNRTNVPVQALMIITGDMRQPDLSFDLRFPTLTSDTYRKVRSIISTEDMMNRQIIYLLALNRFYTPDYMDSTTKGNELFSVASSTISSQLSNMLGKLSDKWSIAPNLRSDRGDFSDVEVDVALSSRLLNNRLLLNGNLGYRDKSLNTNQFIGDFDIEYLLNPKGTWRLKAYNRYNDQNYYVRTATTTQGVGIMFRRDFDNFIPTKTAMPTDTTAMPTDTTAAADSVKAITPEIK